MRWDELVAEGQDADVGALIHPDLRHPKRGEQANGPRCDDIPSVQKFCPFRNVASRWDDVLMRARGLEDSHRVARELRILALDDGVSAIGQRRARHNTDGSPG